MAKKLPPIKSRALKSDGDESTKTTSIEKIKRTATKAVPDHHESAISTSSAAKVEELPLAVPTPALSSNRRLERARVIAARYRALSAAGGLSLLPALDIAVVSALQIKMISSLAKLYDVPFDKGVAKVTVSALIGGSVPQGLAVSAIALVPGPGTLIGIGAGVVSAVVSTDFVAKLFINHFEAGGTLEDFRFDALPSHKD